MYRTVLIPEKRDIHIQIPLMLVGKEIEITAVALRKNKKRKKSGKDISWEEIKEFYYSITPNTASYKFDRDEANER